ncbi:hypothetical protein CKM354_000731200 [Cercospora kikuchii]|uniref:Uncharacterized protein n=1 Tax=Cercospora kikuchii TaxID=84275 RepID=A0A9P3FE75_9PEZI|nr:uncharacterized protein CKM354_000731200 [Cercospora kikuchii]GIZ44103.1 hypothetical protein CKM354_000731200 [Cercospora kikuchii]
MRAIAKRLRDPLDAATDAQKEKCKSMEAAKTEQLPYQRRADFANSLKELELHSKMHADGLKKELATTEQALIALTTGENESAPQGEYGITISGAFKRPRAGTEEADLLSTSHPALPHV